MPCQTTNRTFAPEGATVFETVDYVTVEKRKTVICLQKQRAIKQSPVADHTSPYNPERRIGVDTLRVTVKGEFTFLGPGKVAQLIKCLACKCQNLISDSQQQSQNLCG